MLLVFVPAAQALVLDECEKLYSDVQDLPHFTRAEGAQLQDGLRLIREARSCYGDRKPDRIMRLFLRETAYLYGLGYMREALGLTDSLRQRLASRPDTTIAIHTHQWRGFIHYHAGNLTEAVSGYSTTLAYATEDMPSRRARLSRDIAVIYQRMGDFESARRYLNRGLTIIEEEPPSDDVLGARAQLLGSQGDLLLTEYTWEGGVGREALQDAADLSRESLEIWRELDDRYEQGNNLMALGDALSALGRVEESLAYLEEAAHMADQVGDINRQTTASWKQGQVFLRAGLYDEAVRRLEDALPLAREAGHLDYQRLILSDLGSVFELQQDWERAEHYRRLAVGVTEALRAPLRGTEWSPVAFRQWQAAHRSLVRALLAQEQYEEAFVVLEQTRARHLDDLRQQHHLVAHLEDRHRARFDSLSTQLVDVRTALASDTTSSSTAEALRLQESRLQAKRRSLLDLEDDRTDIDLQLLQEKLSDRDKVLVSYFIGSENRFLDIDPMSHVFVITGDTVVVRPLELSGTELRAMLASVSTVLGGETPVRYGLNEQQFALDALHELYEHLLAPVREHLPEGAPLAIVPDGPLHGFPFAMLVEEEVSRFQYKEAPFLLRRHPISVQLTARTLFLPMEEQRQEMLDLLAVGQSQYQQWAPATLSGITGPDSLIDLPSVPEEVSGIARLFRHADVMVDGQATKSNLQEKAAQARVLHIASHTAFSSLSPFYNALLLGGGAGASERDDDGIVFLHELQQWEVGAELVVLSGCDTGRGVLMGGDGMASLQYAFHSLGVSSSVATLWLVDDRAMADLMQRFYRHLRSGLSKDEALQRAQLDYLEKAKGPRASPFFWASPVLYGATTPLDLAPRPVYQASWFLYLVSLVLLLVAVGVLWHGRRR